MPLATHRYAQRPEDFLAKHKNADFLVIDTETGMPHRAEYIYLNGSTRIYPAIYYYPEY